MPERSELGMEIAHRLGHSPNVVAGFGITFAALADPTRRTILARLAEGEATVNELAEPFEMSLQAISKHLKMLERANQSSFDKFDAYVTALAAALAAA